jgi:hypothetical protein
MFGRKQAKIDGLKMAFYTDAAESGSHGRILVSSRRRGLDHVVVNFVFVGMKEPPALTPSLMEHIWTEAKAQGFVPFEIVGALDVNDANLDMPSKAEPVTDPVAVARAALPALNTQEIGRAPQRLHAEAPAHRSFDPAAAANAEVPAFLRSEPGQPAMA